MTGDVDHVVDGEDRSELLDAARQVAERAHAPYSNFRVGAAVRASDGRVFTGCNVENAAYGSTVCAELNAITTAVAAGAKDLDVIAVSGLDGHRLFPCGDCRQIMREFDIDTLIVDTPEGPETHTLAAILPHSFGPNDLDKQRKP